MEDFMKKIMLATILCIVVITNSFPQSASYKIGDLGPGGGIIFAIEGPYHYEVSRILGTLTWYEADNVAKNYRGGNLSDWYLPTLAELALVYDNLVVAGIINMGSTWYWSSTPYARSDTWSYRKNMGNGEEEPCGKGVNGGARAIRMFIVQ